MQVVGAFKAFIAECYDVEARENQGLFKF